MSKTGQRVLIAIMIVILIIIGIIVYMLIVRQGLNSYNQVDYIEEIGNIDKVEVVSIINNYYMVKDCINKYYTYVAIISEPEEFYGELEGEELVEVKNGNAEELYNILDEEYVKNKGITETNIVNSIEKVKNSVVDVKSMYVDEKDDIDIYIAIGTLREKISGKVSNFKLMLKLDNINATFSILPQSYVEEKYPNIEIGKTLNIESLDRIKENRNNKFTFRMVTDQTYAIDLFTQFKEEFLYNQDAIYNRLDEEYKNAKFSSLAEFRTYMQNKYESLNILNAASYNKTAKEGYSEYVIIDTNGDYYIFKETAPMKYTLILDTYTIELPEFTAKYNGSNAREKVILNLDKFMQSINDKDYKYAYNLLAVGFKANNFKTQAEFENYVKTNLFEKNKFEYQEFGDEANTYYTYKIKITDETGKDTREVTKTFIMLLEEGTNFELSFNI